MLFQEAPAWWALRKANPGLPSALIRGSPGYSAYLPRAHWPQVQRHMRLLSGWGHAALERNPTRTPLDPRKSVCVLNIRFSPFPLLAMGVPQSLGPFWYLLEQSLWKSLHDMERNGRFKSLSQPEEPAKHVAMHFRAVLGWHITWSWKDSSH